MDGSTSEIIPVDLVSHRDLEKDRAEAWLNSKRNFEVNKNRIDKNRRDHELKVNDYV